MPKEKKKKKKHWLELMTGIKNQNSTGSFQGGKTWPPSSNVALKCIQPAYQMVTSVMERFKSSVKKKNQRHLKSLLSLYMLS